MTDEKKPEPTEAEKILVACIEEAGTNEFAGPGYDLGETIIEKFNLALSSARRQAEKRCENILTALDSYGKQWTRMMNELRTELTDEKTLYMDNEREWQEVTEKQNCRIEKLMMERSAYREVAINAIAEYHKANDKKIIKTIQKYQIAPVYIPRREHSEKIVDAEAARVLREKQK